MRALLLCAVLVGVVACMEGADLADPALHEFADMYTVDRDQWGFTPLPRAGSVLIERPARSGPLAADYDAMLHLSGPTSRTIAFERVGERYRWLGEQELTYGPREYETVDGRQREFIAITYNRKALEGQPAGHSVTYWGPDSVLAGQASLALDDVRPLLEQWRRRR